MNGDDRYANHDARINRLEIGIEFLVKRLDDMERRIEARFSELERRMEAGFRDLRTEMRWLVGTTTGLLLTVQIAILGLLLRAQGLL